MSFRKYLNEMLNEKETLEEKTLTSDEVDSMLDTIMDKTRDGDSKNAKEIYKMASGMADDLVKNGGLSPEQVGWAMKTMKALSGK